MSAFRRHPRNQATTKTTKATPKTPLAPVASVASVRVGFSDNLDPTFGLSGDTGSGLDLGETAFDETKPD